MYGLSPVDQLDRLKKKLTSGFFGFWVENRRVSFLAMAIILLYGGFSLYSIPKESSPNIKFGIIAVTTVYQGVNPQDMDTLVTEKIEKEIKNIPGIKKISSTSSVGVSNIIVELENNADTLKVLTDLKDKVTKVNLPTDALDPIVTEISTDNERMFNVLLFGKSERFTREFLQEKAQEIKRLLEGKNGITRIDIDGGAGYEIHIVLDRAKVQQLGISIGQIAQLIRAFNRNQPLGNHTIDGLSYDFRIQGELKDINDLENLGLPINNRVIFLKDIATVKKVYKDDRVSGIGGSTIQPATYVSLTFNKKPGGNIFQSSKQAKQLIDEILQQHAFKGLSVAYTQDIADIINDDYRKLASNGFQTILIVFLSVLLYLGLKESLISTLSLPLAFFITFMFLDKLGLTLNFLTNFSFIICLGIAIDTTTVIIQGAHAKMRMGYNPKSAILLSVKEFRIPLISATATSCVVYLPMFTLPGILGKFLAYIPITIFITLVAGLLISLTINSALFYKLNKPKKVYEKNEEEQFLPADEKQLLAEERQGKQEVISGSTGMRDRILDTISSRYVRKLDRILKHPMRRLATVITPIILLIVSLVTLGPSIGFTLFPGDDNPFVFVTATARKGTTTEYMAQYAQGIDAIFLQIPEIKTYYYVVDKNEINITFELYKKEERKQRGMRDSFTVEEEINTKLIYLESLGLKLESQVQRGGPPSSKAIGIRLIAQTNQDFEKLITVSKDFESYLSTLTGSKNVANSSSSTPGQFVFSFDKTKMALLGIVPTDIAGEIFAALNGLQAGSIKGKYENNDMRLLFDIFEDGATASDVENITVPTRAGSIAMGSISSYQFINAISAINRENGNISIKVEADAEEGFQAGVIQQQFIDFAKNYIFPDGVTFEAGGENQENADLIQATGIAFVIALLMIFTILVLQFNSFTQPMIIMYSVGLGLLGATIGLFVTGNPYSMSFGIGFIALTGIVVNNAIVFLDTINLNLQRGRTVFASILQTGRTRLQPIILTQINTIFGLLPTALQDKFFAGLAYTIMFGLAVATLMTLLVVPVLVHDKHKIIDLIKRGIIAPVIYITIPAIAIGISILIATIIGFPLLSQPWFKFAGMGVFVLWVVGYSIYSIWAIHRYGQTIIQHWLGIHIRSITTAHYPTIKQSIYRYFVCYGMLIIPIVLGIGLSAMMSKMGKPEIGSMLQTLCISLGVGFFIIANTLSIWANQKQKALHDRITKTYVVYDEITE